MVTINSGPVEASLRFTDVPKDKWGILTRKKRDFLAHNITYDCRCLVEFCQQSELVWEQLGFKSHEDMIRNGYELDPVEIKLAVEWLKHNQPDEEISLQNVRVKVRIRQIVVEYPHMTQQQIADLMGCSRQYVHEVLSSKMSESDKLVDTPDHLQSRTDQADYRKLPPELQQKVASKEVSMNAAAIAAGIRRKPTPEEVCIKAFGRVDNRVQTATAIMQLMTPSELDQLKAEISLLTPAEPKATPNTGENVETQEKRNTETWEGASG